MTSTCEQCLSRRSLRVKPPTIQVEFEGKSHGGAHMFERTRGKPVIHVDLSGNLFSAPRQLLLQPPRVETLLPCLLAVLVAGLCGGRQSFSHELSERSFVLLTLIL